jgi:hypothetical protein
MTGPLFLSRDPLTGTEAATKTYVDGKVGGAGFLPLTGGTLTGLLTLSGPPTVANHATTKTYVDTQVATRFPTSGGTITNAITVNGNITTNGGNILARKDTGQSSVAVWNAAVGVNAAMGFWLRSADQISFGNVDGSGLPNLEWWVASSTSFVNTFKPDNTDNLFGLVSSGGVNGHRTLALANGYSLDMDNTATTGHGNMQFNTAKGTIWAMRASDVFAFNSIGPVGGVGAFVNLSDVRFKENIVTATDNLAYIMSMRPVEFDWIATGKHDYGFISQEMATVMPTCVSPMGIELPDGSGGIDDADPTLGIGYTGIIPILVGAMQELAGVVGVPPPPITGMDDSSSLSISTGTVEDGTSGSAYIASGAASGIGNSGEAGIGSGDAAGTGITGDVWIYSGSNTGSGNSGQINIASGNTASGIGGNISITPGGGPGGIGAVLLGNYKTTDPHINGALWCDTAAGHVLKVSAG